MSETPRTDAEQDGSETIDEAFNFARQLERELAEARGQLHLCNVDQFTIAAELAEATVKNSLTVQRPWVGLTDDEVNLIYAEPQTHVGQYAKAIEAKLREKNT